MFEKIEMAPPDPILGLTEQFKADLRPEKINLGVGVFQDASGRTPVLGTVRRAQAALIEKETSKNYLGIAGDPEYTRLVQALVLGPDWGPDRSGLAFTAQTPGGTAALRVAGDFLKRVCGVERIWVSDPTWANHGQVFRAAGLDVKTYPYYDQVGKRLDFDQMLDALGNAPARDAVLLHACCHNPSGMDPSSDQWRALADLTQRRGLLPLFDFAYQGFGRGLDEDAEGLRLFARAGCEFLVASSFSKNFGLYNERTGALTLVAGSKQAAQAAFSHVKTVIRANYSNPPAHGALIVAAILKDSALRQEWEGEVAAMRGRIAQMRRLFVSTLRAKGARQDFSFIEAQQGMFSFSGLNRDQVKTLRERHAIYMVDSGRINVAGMTEANMDRLCSCITDVLNG